MANGLPRRGHEPGLVNVGDEQQLVLEDQLISWTIDLGYEP
jgi:hypothetical protein